MAGLESQNCWQVGPAQGASRPERFRAAEGPCQQFVRPGGESRHPPQIRRWPRLRGRPFGADGGTRITELLAGRASAGGCPGLGRRRRRRRCRRTTGRYPTGSHRQKRRPSRPGCRMRRRRWRSGWWCCRWGWGPASRPVAVVGSQRRDGRGNGRDGDVGRSLAHGAHGIGGHVRVMGSPSGSLEPLSTLPVVVPAGLATRVMSLANATGGRLKGAGVVWISLAGRVRV